MVTIFLFMLGSSLHAQVGVANIGTTSIGYDSLSAPAIGKASTPRCLLPGPCETGCGVYTFI
ncbi:MAG: hypothetical protein ACHQ1D_08685, partial [Nitrososphaerales archaeon]